MKFTYNSYGFLAVIILICVSFIANWVIKPNVKNKFLKIKSSVKQNAVKFSNEYANLNKKNIQFISTDGNFWRKSICKNTIFEEKTSFYSNSLWSLSNVLFKTLLVIKHSSNKLLSYQLYLKIVLAILSLVLCVFLAFNFWVGTSIVSFIIFLMFFVEFLMFNNKISKIKNQMIWILNKNGVDKVMAKKLLKYKRLYFLEKYLSIFSETIISGTLVFMKWGKDD